MDKFTIVRNSPEAVASARTVVAAVGAVRQTREYSELTKEEQGAYTLALVLLRQHIEDTLVQMINSGHAEPPLTKPPHSA